MQATGYGYGPPASVPPQGWVQQPASMQPLDMGSAITRFFVSGPNLGVQFGTHPLVWFPFASIAGATLKRAWSWGQGACWLALALILSVGSGQSILAFMGALVVAVFLGLANAYTRRQYSLTLFLRDGRQHLVFLGVGYPPGPITILKSPWIARLDQGWYWLATQLTQHGARVVVEG